MKNEKQKNALPVTKKRGKNINTLREYYYLL